MRLRRVLYLRLCRLKNGEATLLALGSKLLALSFQKRSCMNLEEIKNKIASIDGVMIHFWGDNCAVCDALKPKIKEAFEENFPKIEQIYIDAKNNQDIAANFSVFSIPTTIVFLDGKEFAREGRAMSVSGLVEKIKRPYEIMFS